MPFQAGWSNQRNITDEELSAMTDQQRAEVLARGEQRAQERQEEDAGVAMKRRRPAANLWWPKL